MSDSREYVPLGNPRLNPIEAITEFAKVLTKFAERYSSTRNVEFEKFFGVKMDRISGTQTDFKPFERPQAIYALNKFIEEYCETVKITNIDDEEGSVAPVSEEIRIGRNEYKRLLTIGEIFLKWKNKKFILYLHFEGEWSRRSILFCKTKDLEIADKFNEKFREFMQKYNIFKGEKLVYLPRSEFNFLEYPKLGWDDAVLRDEVKEEIILNSTFPLSIGDKCIECGIPWRRGLLFGGVAGTGKTQVCKILCNEIGEGITVIWATPKALYDCDVVSTLFEAARYFNPTLIIIEDIDFIGTDRSIDNSDILGELLTQLDGNDPNHGVFVVATTNRLQILDLALANRPSRFDVKIEFPIPEDEERKKLIRLFTKNMMFEHDLDYGALSNMMTGLTGAHIKEIFVYAQLMALKRGTKKIKIEDVRKRSAFYKKNESNMVV